MDENKTPYNSEFPKEVAFYFRVVTKKKLNGKGGLETLLNEGWRIDRVDDGVYILFKKVG